MALAVIDGVIDSPRARSQLADKPDTFFLAPDAVAETVYWLTQQKKSAWIFELEVRPFCRELASLLRRRVSYSATEKACGLGVRRLAKSNERSAAKRSGA